MTGEEHEVGRQMMAGRQANRPSDPLVKHQQQMPQSIKMAMARLAGQSGISEAALVTLACKRLLAEHEAEQKAKDKEKAAQNRGAGDH